MKKYIQTIFIVSLLFIVLISMTGCITNGMAFTDRKRTFFYLPPDNFNPYSKSVLKELGYTAQWELPLADIVNVNVSSLDMKSVTTNSFVVSMIEETLNGDRQTHFLIKGIDTPKPEIFRTSFKGHILPVNGRLYAVEEKNSGNIFYSLNDRMSITGKKNIILNRFARHFKNDLNSTSTGNYYLEANIYSYYVYYPYVIFVSTNYKTNRFYNLTRYQSENVLYNSVEFVCINIETDEMIEAKETDLTPYYRMYNSNSQGGVFTPSGFFTIVDNGAYLVFSLSNQEGRYINGYFRLVNGNAKEIVFDTADNLVRKFPTLVTQKFGDKSKEILVMEKSIQNKSFASIAGIDMYILNFILVPDRGYVVFAKEQGEAVTSSTMYFVDLKLDKIFWKREFKPGLIVKDGNLTSNNSIYFPDIDKDGKGFLAAKSLASGEEIRLLPVNLVMRDGGLTWQYFAMQDRAFITFDDEKYALIYYRQ